MKIRATVLTVTTALALIVGAPSVRANSYSQLFTESCGSGCHFNELEAYAPGATFAPGAYAEFSNPSWTDETVSSDWAAASGNLTGFIGYNFTFFGPLPKTFDLYSCLFAPGDLSRCTTIVDAAVATDSMDGWVIRGMPDPTAQYNLDRNGPPVTPSAVPEPPAWALLIVGLVGLALCPRYHGSAFARAR